MFGPVVTTCTHTMGYYVFNFVFDIVTLQEDIILWSGVKGGGACTQT